MKKIRTVVTKTVLLTILIIVVISVVISLTYSAQIAERKPGVSGGEVAVANSGVVTTTGVNSMETIKVERLAAVANVQSPKLVIKGIEHQGESFTVRFYLNADQESIDETPDDKYYVGTFYMYGHGDGIQEGKTIVPLQPFDSQIDLTRSSQRINQRSENLLSFVVLDQQGNLLPASTFKYKALEIAND